MSSNVATIEKAAVRSVLIDMSARYGMEPSAFEQTLRATVVPEKCSKEQFAAFLLVAKEYALNPITKEIYAFPTRGGGIQPIVGVDGWMNLMNSHPGMDGLEFDDHFEGGDLTAVTARIWRKDRAHPIVVTEYMNECARETEPWKKWPRRMLRHKAAIQCARYAFGFAGIIDPDEAERNPDVISPMKDVTPPSPPPAPESVAEVVAAGDAIDIERFLSDLDEQLAGAETEDQLNEIWDTNAEQQVKEMAAADSARAAKLYRDHLARVTAD